jgi:hypothetical protein
LAIAGLYVLRPPPQEKLVYQEPEVKVVERIIERPPPAPPAAVSLPPARPSPSSQTRRDQPTPFRWDGTWQMGDNPVPLFVLKQTGEALSGTFTLADDAIFPFSNGIADHPVAKFKVIDQGHTIAFAMTLISDQVALVEAWQRHEEYMNPARSYAKLRLNLIPRQPEVFGTGTHRIGMFRHVAGTAAPAPVATKPPTPCRLNGVWRVPGNQLPILELKQSGDSLSGKYTPDLLGTYEFTGGKVTASGADFVVEDYRHVPTYMSVAYSGGGALMVSKVQKVEDLLKLIGKPMNTFEQIQFKRDLENAGKRINLGLFQKIADASVGVDKPKLSKWDGAWRMAGTPLPVFELTQAGDSVSGTYTPVAPAHAYRFADGSVTDTEVNFIVETFRRLPVSFRFTLLPGGDAQVEQMQKSEDIRKLFDQPLSILEKLQLNRDLADAGKFLKVGTFQRMAYQIGHR